MEHTSPLFHFQSSKKLMLHTPPIICPKKTLGLIGFVTFVK